MLDISGAYEKLSKICNYGDKNGCLNKNCAKKTVSVRTKQVLLRLWTKRLKAVNLMRVITD